MTEYAEAAQDRDHLLEKGIVGVDSDLSHGLDGAVVGILRYGAGRHKDAWIEFSPNNPNPRFSRRLSGRDETATWIP